MDSRFRGNDDNFWLPLAGERRRRLSLPTKNQQTTFTRVARIEWSARSDSDERRETWFR
jgi:hypothetical protein